MDFSGLEDLRRIGADMDTTDGNMKRLANSIATIKERQVLDKIRLAEGESQLKGERSKIKALEKCRAACLKNLEGKTLFVTEQAHIDVLAAERLTLQVQIYTNRRDILEKARENGMHCVLIPPSTSAGKSPF